MPKACPKEFRDDVVVMVRWTELRICLANGWFSVFSRKQRGRNTRPGPPAHDNLMCREFTAGALYEVWLGEITAHRTLEGKLYVCAIKDVFPNGIVGYSIDSRKKSRIAVNTLNGLKPAVVMLPDASCIPTGDLLFDPGSTSAR